MPPALPKSSGGARMSGSRGRGGRDAACSTGRSTVAERGDQAGSEQRARAILLRSAFDSSRDVQPAPQVDNDRRGKFQRPVDAQRRSGPSSGARQVLPLRTSAVSSKTTMTGPIAARNTSSVHEQAATEHALASPKRSKRWRGGRRPTSPDVRPWVRRCRTSPGRRGFRIGGMNSTADSTPTAGVTCCRQGEAPTM